MFHSNVNASETMIMHPNQAGSGRAGFELKDHIFTYDQLVGNVMIRTIKFSQAISHVNKNQRFGD
jgi:hypothetical protein